MFTIRRAIVTLTVAVGLSAASVGLASAAAGGPTSTGPTTTVAGASPAAAGFIGSTAGTASSASVHASEEGQAQSGVDEANYTGDNGWCATYGLALTGVGENWFGSLHIASICDRPHA